MKNEIAVALFITNYISMEKCDRGSGRRQRRRVGRGSGVNTATDELKGCHQPSRAPCACVAVLQCCVCMRGSVYLCLCRHVCRPVLASGITKENKMEEMEGHWGGAAFILLLRSLSGTARCRCVCVCVCTGKINNATCATARAFALIVDQRKEDEIGALLQQGQLLAISPLHKQTH